MACQRQRETKGNQTQGRCRQTDGGRDDKTDTKRSNKTKRLGDWRQTLKGTLSNLKSSNILRGNNNTGIRKSQAEGNKATPIETTDKNNNELKRFKTEHVVFV